MKEIRNTSPIRGWSCHFKDGRVVDNLTHEESFDLFQLALATDNTCTVRPPHTPYNAP